MASGVRLARAEVKDTIGRFLDGTGAPWDWDDFVSFTIDDAFLDAIRVLCLSLPEGFPAVAGSAHYCNERGLALLRAISEAL